MDAKQRRCGTWFILSLLASMRKDAVSQWFGSIQVLNFFMAKCLPWPLSGYRTGTLPVLSSKPTSSMCSLNEFAPLPGWIREQLSSGQFRGTPEEWPRCLWCPWLSSDSCDKALLACFWRVILGILWLAWSHALFNDAKTETPEGQ